MVYNGVVIDSCRVKVVEYDADRNISCLLTKIAAKDSMTQRTGRAGRIQPGLCFRLVTTTTYEVSVSYMYLSM